MKRGTPDHPKMHDLRAALGIPIYSAVGLLELLWHFTAKYAERGDLGRHSNEAIARAVGWRGRPDKLVNALVACRWVDADPVHRLLVHDWQAHADEGVRKNLKNHGAYFLERFQNGSEHPQGGGENHSGLPMPMPMPMPEPIAVGVPTVAATRKKPALRPKQQPVFWSLGSGWQEITDEDRQEWAAAYSACDLNMELTQMSAWLHANPAKARKSNWRRFISNWLKRSHDRSSEQSAPIGVSAYLPPIQQPTSEQEEAYRRAMLA